MCKIAKLCVYVIALTIICMRVPLSLSDLELFCYIHKPHMKIASFLHCVYYDQYVCERLAYINVLACSSVCGMCCSLICGKTKYISEMITYGIHNMSS